MSVDKFLTANGWADDRLMQAFDLIWEVMKDNAALGLDNEFNAILNAIEPLSEAMAEVRADQAQERAAALETLAAIDGELL